MRSLFYFFIFFANFVFGQVGINSTAPRGVLDVRSPQENLGMVLPSVTKIEDVINPQTNDGNVPSGTIVFDISRNKTCIRYGNVWQCTDVNGEKSIVSPPFSPDYNYIKASNTTENTLFGNSVSLSLDGSTMAVGSYMESSDAKGINGNESGTTMAGAGAVYVYKRTGGVWVQEAYIKASNTRSATFFGNSVSLSSDGSTLAVGSPGESSNAKGVNGDELNTTMDNAGAVYVYKRTGAVWSQEAYVKASNTRAQYLFGNSVSLSADGSVLAVGSPGESSNATGVNGDESNTTMDYSGAVYVYKRTGVAWSQEAYVKASNTRVGTSFGYFVSLSSDGSTLAVGSPDESSNAKGINGDQSESTVGGSGAVYVYKRVGSSWSQEAYVKASNTRAGASFGSSVALSSDASTMAVGSYKESSNATGINGDESDESMPYAGAVYVYKRTGGVWAQEAYVKASNVYDFTFFGFSVSLSSDGSTMTVGRPREGSGAKGINGDEEDITESASGAVYVYKRTGTTWAQESYVKASNTRAYALFGWSVALSLDGSTMAVGSTSENSNARGVNGDESDASMNSAGAVYVLQKY